MAESKVVPIFVLFCCAVRLASGSIVSPSTESEISPNTMMQASVFVRTDNSDFSWDFPANLGSDRTLGADASTHLVGGTMIPAPAVIPALAQFPSFWLSPPVELVATDQDVAEPPPIPSDLHGTTAADAMQLMSVASVAIPLHSALAATAAAILPIAFLIWLWKKSNRPCD